MKIDKIQIQNEIYSINGPATAQEYGLIKLGYQDDDKNYAVKLDNSGKAYVYVPWTNTTYTLSGLMGSSAKGSTTQPIYWNGSQFVSTTHSLNTTVPANAVFTDTTYGVATANDLGLIKLGYQAEQNSKNYPVTVDTNNKAYVNVPWTDTDTIYTLPSATSDTLGGIKASQHSGSVTYNTVSSTAGRYYQVEIDSNDGATKGRAFVNVPWEASLGGGGGSVGFDSVSAGDTVISSSSQSDLYISSHGGISATIDQGIGSISDKNVVYVDINAATNTIYGGIKIDSQSSLIDLTAKNYPVKLDNNGFAYVYVPVTDGDDGIGIDDITVEYQSGDSGTTAPSDSLAQNDGWASAVPSVNPGDYLWTRITITTTALTNNTFTAYSVARQGVDGNNSGGGSGSSAMSINSTTNTGLPQLASPNTLYIPSSNTSSVTGNNTVNLTGTVSGEVCSYAFRFLTGATIPTITFNGGNNIPMFVPDNFPVLESNTWYEVDVIYDGTAYTVSAIKLELKSGSVILSNNIT